MTEVIVSNLKSKQRQAYLISDPLLTAAKPRKLQKVYRILASQDRLDVSLSNID